MELRGDGSHTRQWTGMRAGRAPVDVGYFRDPQNNGREGNFVSAKSEIEHSPSLATVFVARQISRNQYLNVVVICVKLELSVRDKCQYQCFHFV